jgi:RNA polymerase-associated protein LEO1
LSRGAPRKPSFPPSRPPRRQEYSESEREEESEYETEGEDIEHSPTAGREDMLDEEDEYEEDVEEEAAMSDEEIQVKMSLPQTPNLLASNYKISFYKVCDVVDCSNLPI